MIEIPEWPFSLGAPGGSGVIRSCPEDFIVEEIAKVQPSGEGGHLWLWVQKRSANTDWVARELARAAGCAFRDVGFAGLKDRHAVTLQWFSVPVTGDACGNLDNAGIEGVQILASQRHTRKLKRGTLSGNRFRLKIRGLSCDRVQTEQRLQKIRSQGVPNYFGPQRFGRGGQNVQRGYDLLKRRTRLQRNKRSIYLSALRSYLFNQVLAQRVRQGNWNSMLDGDLAMLEGTQSVFACDMPNPDIEDRCRRLDIHPTGPLPGVAGTQPDREAAELERSVLENWSDLTNVLCAQRVQASRRSLRLHPAEFAWKFGDSELDLTFVLSAGSYATTVLREILIFREAERV
jgi:tRNA pseudouridine13 synthase